VQLENVQNVAQERSGQLEYTLEVSLMHHSHFLMSMQMVLAQNPDT
jgi:hypothetical protein